MWGLLIRENSPGVRSVELRPSFDRLLPPDEEQRSASWLAYFGGVQVGTAYMFAQRMDTDDISVQAVTRIFTNSAASVLFGSDEDIVIKFEMRVSALRGLNDFRLECKQMGAALIGTLTPDALRVSGVIGNQKVNTSMPFQRDMLVASMLSPIAALPELTGTDVGRTWSFQMVNPLAGGVQQVNVRVAGTREIDLPEQTADAFLLQFSTGTARWTAWILANGEVLMQGTPLGLVLQRADLTPEAISQLRTPEPDGTTSGASP
jgi:hypothetical protein